MSQYIFKCIQHDGTEIIVTTDKELLPDILEGFTAFLRGCGFGDTIIEKYIDSE